MIIYDPLKYYYQSANYRYLHNIVITSRLTLDLTVPIWDSCHSEIHAGDDPEYLEQYERQNSSFNPVRSKQALGATIDQKYKTNSKTSEVCPEFDEKLVRPPEGIGLILIIPAEYRMSSNRSIIQRDIHTVTIPQECARRDIASIYISLLLNYTCRFIRICVQWALSIIVDKHIWELSDAVSPLSENSAVADCTRVWVVISIASPLGGISLCLLCPFWPTRKLTSLTDVATRFL